MQQHITNQTTYDGVPHDEDFGDTVIQKPDGICRLTSGNLNGFSPRSFHNEKAEELRHFIQDLNPDMHCGQEGNINWEKMPRRGRLQELFRTENALRTQTGHNIHGSHGMSQQGGTFMLAFGEMATRVTQKGSDETGLGRWTWMRFQGKNQQVTRIISAYRPCRSSPNRPRTVYNQHKLYFRGIQRAGCPRTLWIEDLGTKLQEWRAAGEKLLVFMDGNENMKRGAVHDMFQVPELQMREVVLERHPELPQTPTFKAGGRHGKHPIDGIWATRDLDIEKGTWLAFDRAPGDHRYGVIDIKWEVLLGENPLKIVRPQARRLVCSIPSAKGKYLELLKKHFKKHNLLQKLHQVYKHSSAELSEEDETKLEKIDKLRKDGMLYAEKRCRKLCMGMIPFSPLTNQARKTKELWRAVLKKKEGGKVSCSWIRRLARACEILHPLSITLERAKVLDKESVQAYNALKPQAGQHRSKWLQSRLKDSTLPEESIKAAKQQLRAETQRDDARRIAKVLEKMRAGSIGKIEVLVNGNYEVQETQTEVEDSIMKMADARFRLTEDTPPMTAPLQSDLGYLGCTEDAHSILEGTYTCPPEVDDYTRFFIAALKAANLAGPPVSSEISKEDYIGYWKKAKEKTASSISGLHFGHWKAAASEDYLAEIHALATELAYSSGYSMTRWQAGLTVMLEKKKGVIKVDKLRAILLMEADFNFANKLIFGSRMLRQAMERGEIPEECFGSINHHEAIEVAIGRRLVGDLSRQRRFPMAISSVDAQTCYDRISHAIASICCQRWKVDEGPIKSMLQTIQKMKFFLRTAHGDSDSSYGGDGLVPYQGACQGNGGGPAIWLAVSVVLVLLLHNRNHISSIRSALSATLILFAGFLFVDDTDLITFAEDQDTTSATIIERMQAANTTWHGGLRATGGALKPEKCSWCLLAYKWHDGQWTQHTKETLPAEIQVTGPDGVLTTISRQNPDEAIKVVGVFQAMNGSMQTQLKELTGRADSWAIAIDKGWLPRNLAWAALRQSVWASIKYPLPATTFTEAEGDKIMTKFYKTTLGTLGVCRNISKVYRHAPIALLGLELPKPTVEQGILQLKYFLVHGSIPTLTGKFFRASLEQAQLEVGSSKPLFQTDFARYGPLMTDDTLIKSLWKFLWQYHIHVDGEEIPLPQPQRDGDVFLMDQIMSQQAMSAREKLGFNRCRLHMQTLTMADIATGDGTAISVWARDGIPDIDRPSKWIWQLENPGAEDRRAWRKGLALLSSEEYFKLPQESRLGQWITPPHRSRWNWRYDPTTHLLFQYLRGVWFQFTKLSPNPPRNGSMFRREMALTGEPAATTLRATAWTDHTGAARFEGAAVASIPQTIPPLSIQSYIDSLTDNWPLDRSHFPGNGIHVANAIRNHSAQGVCDGSYMPKQSYHLGTAAWILEDSRYPNVQRCSGICQTSGTPEEVNAYRSELQGVHAKLLALKAICKFHHIEEGGITLGCDNRTGVRLADQDFLRIMYNKKHVDMIRAIRRLKSELPITIKFIHIYGHQDDYTEFCLLPRMTQLNVLMDGRAKKLLRRLIRQEEAGRPARCPDRLASEGWICRVGNRKITSDPSSLLRRQAMGTQMRDLLHRKKQLHKTAFDWVDWDALQDAMESLPQLFRLWITKHASGWCAVGKMMKIWGYWEESTCPCCKIEPVETTYHLLRCPDERLATAWQTQLEGLEVWLNSAETHPSITHCLLETLKTRDPSTSFRSASDALTRSAAIEQDKIGWFNLTEGKLSQKWKLLQRKHLRQIKSIRSERQWIAALITHLLELTHAMWLTRNAVVHEKAKNGLLIAEAAELDVQVRLAFDAGTEHLAQADHWYITQGLEYVLALPGHDQQNWLDGLQLARSEYIDNYDHDMNHMRQNMQDFLLHPD